MFHARVPHSGSEGRVDGCLDEDTTDGMPHLGEVRYEAQSGSETMLLQGSFLLTPKTANSASSIRLVTSLTMSREANQPCSATCFIVATSSSLDGSRPSSVGAASSRERKPATRGSP